MTISELKELCDKEIEKGKGDYTIWVNMYDMEGDASGFTRLKKGFDEYYDYEKYIMLG